MAETTHPAEWRTSKRRRIIKVCKWLLVVFLFLFASNWICSAIYARKNEKLTQDFYKQVGATTASDLVGYHGRNPVAGNGWYLYLASLACVSQDTLEAHPDHPAEPELQLAPKARSQREAELDRAHRLIEEARSAPRNAAVFHRDGFDHQPLLPLTSYTRVALASAREHRQAGDIQRARERLIDTFHVSQGVLGLPTSIGYIVETTVLSRIEGEIIATLPDLADADLATFDELLAGVNLRQAMKEAMVGEVFFSLRGWNIPTPIFHVGYPSLLFEIDRSHYLERMIPLALDPESEEAMEQFRRPVPSYARTTRMVMPTLLDTFDRRPKVALVCLDLTREALQREAKRRRGEEFDYPSPNEHIVIEKTTKGVRLSSEKTPMKATIGG